MLKMHERGTQPTWEHCEVLFGEHVPAAGECVVNEFHGDKLKNACKKMKKHRREIRTFKS